MDGVHRVVVHITHTLSQQVHNYSNTLLVLYMSATEQVHFVHVRHMVKIFFHKPVNSTLSRTVIDIAKSFLYICIIQYYKHEGLSKHTLFLLIFFIFIFYVSMRGAVG